MLTSIPAAASCLQEYTDGKPITSVNSTPGQMLKIAIVRSSSCLLLLATCIGSPTFALAQVTPQTNVIPTTITNLFEESCLGCHDAETAEGDLRLDSLQLHLDDSDVFHKWQRVYDRVLEGEMPPDETLDSKTQSAFIVELKRQLHAADSKRIASKGRVPARRLTRAQYARSINQLLAIDIPIEEYLPADLMNNGFDTVSSGQQISNHLMSAYLKVADIAVDSAMRSMKPAKPWKERFDWTDLARDEKQTNREPEGRPEHQDIVSWSTLQNFYGRMEATTVPHTGRYRIKVRVKAVNPPPEGRIWCSLRSGACSGKESTLYWIDAFEVTHEPSEHQFEAWIRKGHMLQLRPNDSGLKKVPLRGEKSIRGPRGVIEPLGYPGVSVQWIEMERISPSESKVRQALFGDDKRASSQELSPDDIDDLIRRFACRAFRRPVTDEELTAYFDFANSAYQDTGSRLKSLLAAFRAILCSSRFLYLEEASGELDDHALATRLSYFLWGTYPDSELKSLAAAGKLSHPDRLRKQVERMLDDERSQTFVREFSNQWLMLYELNATTPDGKLYPEYDDVLHHSLSHETYAFVEEMIRHDLPVTTVVDSDFTFLNSRLARHYHIDWPGGTGVRRVNLNPQDLRGGLITHASILKVTANGTATSPIVRGVWMLERIMGQHVPPPPANVPAVEPDIRGATTIREQLSKHRKLESCAACHIKIDPPGFALENYDVIGGFRERYRAASNEKRRGWIEGPKVDPSYSLSTGEAFRDLVELKQILNAQPEQLALSLASQLITYSTGAQPTFADRETLDAIVESVKSKNFGVRSLIHEVVQSAIFRQK